MAKMQNTNSNRNVAQTTSISLSQRHSWSISMLLSIIRFINFQFTPPFHIFNICNNILVNEQANIGDAVSLSSRPHALYLTWSVLLRAILFAEGGIFPPKTFMNICSVFSRYSNFQVKYTDVGILS